MAKAIYIGVGGVSRVAKAGYIGVNGVARKFTGDEFGVKQIIIDENEAGLRSFTALYTDSDGNSQEFNSNDHMGAGKVSVSIRTPSNVYVLSREQKRRAILDANSSVITPTRYIQIFDGHNGTVYQF